MTKPNTALSLAVLTNLACPQSLLSRRAALPLLLVVVALSGCGNMTGIGGTSEYGCKAPDGVQCDSVAGTYANSLTNNLPSQRGRKRDMVKPNTVATFDAVRAPAPAGDGYAPQALRTDSRVMRLWVKAWEDQDHDLVDQSYVYVQVDNGHWLVQHAQAQNRAAFAPLRPPATAPSGTADKNAPTGPGTQFEPLPGPTGEPGVSAAQPVLPALPPQQ